MMKSYSTLAIGILLCLFFNNGFSQCEEASINCNNNNYSNSIVDSDSDIYSTHCGHSGYLDWEDIIRVDVTSVPATLTLSAMTTDLDMFVYDECVDFVKGFLLDECLYSSREVGTTEETIIINTDGTYYVVIETFLGLQSPYNLNLSCANTGLDCSNARSLGCGQSELFGTFNEPTNVDSYCNSQFTTLDLGEVVYEINIPFVGPGLDGDYVFTLTGVNPSTDLDMFLLASCDEDDCIASSDSSSPSAPDVITTPLSGGRYYLVVDTDGPIASNYTITMECNQNNLCSNAIDIFCGETLTRTTIAQSNDFTISDYSSCYSSNNNFNGRDIVFQFERFSFGEISYITLESGTEDLDLFILDECTSGLNCIDFSVRSITCSGTQSLDQCYPSGINVDVVEIRDRPAGTYYIVIDGFNNSQEGTFNLTLSCEGLDCSNATPLTCNTTVTGTNVGAHNGSSAYDLECFAPNEAQGMFTAGEAMYEFTAPTAGEYDICLIAQPVSTDLELFIISECCPVDVVPHDGQVFTVGNSSCLEDCLSGSTSSNGEETETVSLAAGQTIIIIVDGFLGAEAPFTLEVKCPEICSSPQNQFCFDFSNFNTGIGVSGQSNSWQNIFSGSDLDCRVQREATASSNNVLEVIDSNFSRCSSGLTINDGTGSDKVQLSYRVKMPYYNFGSFPLQADGAEISIFENNPLIPGDDNIYLALRPHSDSNIDDRRVCLNINNVFESDGCSSGDGELFPIRRNDWNDVVVTLEKSTQTVAVFINNQLVGSAVGTGITRLGVVVFSSSFNPFGPSLFDDICFDTCRDCEDEVFHVVDENGNMPCDDISISTVRQSSSTQVSTTFSPGAIPGQFERWEIRDANTDQVIQTSTANANSYSYCCFQPGRFYYVCYWYRDTQGCLTFCCIRYTLPNNCTYINPTFTGNENNTNYNLTVENVPSNTSVVNWYDGVSTSSIGSANTISYTPVGSGGTRFICCLLFDSVSREFVLCCRRVFVGNPFNCNSFNYTFSDTNNTYTFNAVSGASNITWSVVSPTSAVLGFSSSQTFRPTDFNIPITNGFSICYRYLDQNGTIQFCCRIFDPPSCDDVFYTIDDNGNRPCDDIDIQTLGQSSASQVTTTFTPGNIPGQFERWEIRDGETEQVLQTSSTNANAYTYCCFEPGNSYFVCYWYRDNSNCLTFCCIRYEIPSNCTFITPRFTGNQNTISYNLTLEGLSAGQQVVAWYEANSNIGSSASISYIPPSVGARFICCLIYDSINKRHLVCCRRILIDNPFACNAISSQYDPFIDQYTFTANGAVSDIVWFLDSPTQAIIGFNNPQTFRPSSFNIPNGSSFQISYRLLDTDGSFRFCCRTISPQPQIDPVRLEIGTTCGAIGSTVRVPVQAFGFNDLAQGAFTVSLDNSFARIVDVELVNLPPSDISNSINDRTFVFNWFDNTTNGVTLADGTHIVDIVLEILGNGFQESAIRITDDPAEASFTTADLNPVDVISTAGEVCLASQVTIAGTIATSDSRLSTNVTVNLISNTSNQDNTGTTGDYSFLVDAGQNYTVIPSKDINDREGISGIDLLILQRHLVFVNRITDPYQMIAADLNNDGNINGVDLLLLQRMIVFITPQFQFVDSWRFVDSDHSFNTTNPIANGFPEAIVYNPINGTDPNADFVAVKMGDLNGDATSLGDNGSNSVRRMCRELVVFDNDVVGGDNLEVTFRADGFTDVAVFTAEIQLDMSKISYDSFVGSDLEMFTENNVSTAISDQGYLIVNWVSPSGTGINLDDGESVFTLRFNALEDGQISDLISITNDNLTSEVVNNDLTSQCLELRFDQPSSTDNIKDLLIINGPFPNPSQSELHLELSSNSLRDIDIEVFDHLGKTLVTEQISISGLVNYKLNLKDMGYSEGLYFIKISLGDKHLTKKLILTY